jgi:transposase
LIGFDPYRDLPPDHLARLGDQVVDETVKPPKRPDGPGQPPFDPRLCLKVLVYGYATGMRSSRRLEQACQEKLAFL